MSEHNEQCQVIEYCKRVKTPIFAIPNGVYLKDRATATRIMAKMKKEGLKKGVPDLFIPVAKGGYHGLFIEMKFGKNKLTWYKGLTEKEGEIVISQTISIVSDYAKLEVGGMWHQVKLDSLRIGSPWEYEDGFKCFEGDEVLLNAPFVISGVVECNNGTWEIKFEDAVDELKEYVKIVDDKSYLDLRKGL